MKQNLGHNFHDDGKVETFVTTSLVTQEMHLCPQGAGKLLPQYTYNNKCLDLHGK